MGDPFVGWNQYPLQLPEACEDGPFYRALLEERATLVFTADASNIRLEALKKQPSARDATPLTVALKDCDGLERWLRDGRTGPSDEFYVVHQTNTRSRIQMTVEMFCLLCHALQILPSFIDITTAFGFKISNTDEYFTTCYQRLIRDNDDSSNLTKFTRYDICFNIRYMEEHGRSGLTDPWSFRQMAVYQRHDFPQGRSSCVFIQPPLAARETIERLLQAPKEQQDRSPLLIHLQLLKICARKWRWYLNYLSDGLRDMKDEITWARITKPQSNTGFDQSQNLEVLRWKLRQARAILESNISVGSSILRHAKDITPSVTRHRPMAIHDHMQLKSELVHYISDLRMHRRKASDLLDSTGSLDSLILKLLDLRNYNVSNKNAAALKNLAEASSMESRLMVQIARHTSHDSRVMKITSFIAVIFLPATLISSIFSTDLVSSASSDKQLPPRLILLYATLTIILTAITMAGVYLWSKKTQQLHASRPSP